MSSLLRDALCSEFSLDCLADLRVNSKRRRSPAMPSSETVLYFDCFRGFNEARLSLSDVNFFVGENSTGKSSILSAIQILLSDSLWMQGRFNTEHVDLGNFSEIANPGSNKFSFGFYVQNEDVTKENRAPSRIRAALVSFAALSGEPRIQSLCVLVGTYEIVIESAAQDEPEGKYFIRESSPADVGKTIFDRWIKREPLSKGGNGVRKLEQGWPTLREFPMILMALVASQYDAHSASGKIGKRKKSKAITSQVTRRIASFSQLNLPLSVPLWIAPIRAKPRRIYEHRTVTYSPEGEHIPQWLSEVSVTGPKRWEATSALLTQYASDGHLFQGLKIRRFGEDAQAPFDIQIKLDEKISTSIHNVGYGVSQSLPVIAETLLRESGEFLAIQQPEVHLHPRAQAVLGDLFFDMSIQPHNKKFLIETHSDYVIDRYRSRMRATSVGEIGNGKPVPSAQVVYFSRTEEGNRLHSMKLTAAGEYPESQPSGFRDFFVLENLKNLGF